MVSIIISLLALALSAYSYFRFDRKIKKQEEFINAHEIAKIQEEVISKNHANLAIDKYWRDKDTLYMIVRNEGPSDAYNVSVVDLEKESFLFQNIKSRMPIEVIYAGDDVQLELMVYSDMPQKTRLKVDWDDDSNQHNSDKVIFCIH